MLCWVLWSWNYSHLLVNPERVCVNMDERLKIENELRSGPPNGMASIPLASLAWRYLKNVYLQQARSRKQLAERAAGRRKNLGDLAQEVFQLKRQATTQIGVNSVLPVAERMQKILEELDTYILSTDGQVYGEDLMEILDNLVTQPDPNLTQPMVNETILPTIFCEGELVQRGKAVIGVPER
jgi:hypothetical protein